MIVVLHVLIAISSILYTTYTSITPSRTKLRIAYGLFGATLATGTQLVITTDAPVVSACLIGLIYIVVITSSLAIAHRRFTYGHGS